MEQVVARRGDGRRPDRDDPLLAAFSQTPQITYVKIEVRCLQTGDLAGPLRLPPVRCVLFLLIGGLHAPIGKFLRLLLAARLGVDACGIVPVPALAFGVLGGGGLLGLGAGGQRGEGDNPEGEEGEERVRAAS